MAFLIYKVLIFLFGLHCCFTESENKTFRKDYIHIEELETFYKEYKIKRNWNDALAVCREEGAKMFLPRSQSELEVVAQTFNSSDKYWLAYQDILSDGCFVAVDGRPEDEVYVNWAENEPITENDSQHCVRFDRIYKTYVVDSCEIKLPFICKKNATTIEKNTYCDTYDKNYRFTKVTNRCYKFHAKPAKWQEAFRICSNEGANLAIINSEQEAELFVVLFKKYPIGSLRGTFNKHILHLGFSDLVNTDNYKTVNGQTLKEAGYDNWSTGYEGSAPQPDNENGNEHCGSMYRDGTLNDVNCDTKAMFICEKILSPSFLEGLPSKLSLPDVLVNRFSSMDIY